MIYYYFWNFVWRLYISLIAKCLISSVYSQLCLNTRKYLLQLTWDGDEFFPNTNYLFILNNSADKTGWKLRVCILKRITFLHLLLGVYNQRKTGNILLPLKERLTNLTWQKFYKECQINKCLDVLWGACFSKKSTFTSSHKLHCLHLL